MVAFSFFIAFGLSLQKVYRFFIVASDHIMATRGKKKTYAPSPSIHHLQEHAMLVEDFYKALKPCSILYKHASKHVMLDDGHAIDINY